MKELVKRLVIAIGADHRGFRMKEFIKNNLSLVRHNIEWIDVGAYNAKRSDYPIFAAKAVSAITKGQAQLAILLCGTGIGMAIAANRFPGIFAGLAWNNTVARLAKEDDNVNVLVLPSDFITKTTAVQMTKAWLKASFKKGRYAQRIKLIDII
jgi:ribose 5-phosphate isomerase B